MIQRRVIPPPGRAATGRAGLNSTAGPSAAPGRPTGCPGSQAPQAVPRAAPSTAAPGSVATRLPAPAAPMPAASHPAASPAAAKLAAALTPAARARGVLTASELAAADADPFGPAAAAIAPAPPRPVNGKAAAGADRTDGKAAAGRVATGRADEPPEAMFPQADEYDAGEDTAGPGGPVTREECERATRAGRWIGLATPAAWRAALERDEQRHSMALGLLRKQLWGLYERQRLVDRDIGQLWLALVDLQETLRRALRGDTDQGALFGLIVNKEAAP